MACLVTMTTAAIAAEAMASSFGFIVIVSLIVSLAAWELAGDSKGLKLKLLAQHLSLSIIPLLFIFVSIMFINGL